MHPRLFSLLAFIACISAHLIQAQDAASLLEQRKGHETVLEKKIQATEALPTPPAGSGFELVHYDSKLGKMPAYLSKGEAKGGKAPAIIWLTGGFPVSSPGSFLWEKTTAENEQSARVYRLQGVTMLFPSLRGGAAGNPGMQESFYGEVDDVLSAAAYLRAQDFVDPQRIYLGGHSTGGTLALLCAASSADFAGVLSLGPTADDYGKENATYAWTAEERRLRQPVRYLDAIKVPTWIVEGERGNATSLATLRAANKNKLVTIVEVAGSDHFEDIHPVNSMFARSLSDSGAKGFSVSADALRTCVVDYKTCRREQRDLERLAGVRAGGTDFSKPRLVTFHLFAAKAESFEKCAADAVARGFAAATPTKETESDGSSYYEMKLTRTIDLSNLKILFVTTALVSSLAERNKLQYGGWGVE